MSSVAMTHITEGLCLNALFMLKVENSLICLVGTCIPTIVRDRMSIGFVLDNINKVQDI
jgi:hypothetical protein